MAELRGDCRRTHIYTYTPYTHAYATHIYTHTCTHARTQRTTKQYDRTQNTTHRILQDNTTQRNAIRNTQKRKATKRYNITMRIDAHKTQGVGGRGDSLYGGGGGGALWLDINGPMYVQTLLLLCTVSTPGCSIQPSVHACRGHYWSSKSSCPCMLRAPLVVQILLSLCTAGNAGRPIFPVFVCRGHHWSPKSPCSRAPHHWTSKSVCCCALSAPLIAQSPKPRVIFCCGPH